jgi:hypothetical protein
MKLLLNEPQREHNTGFASLLADTRANAHKQRTQSPRTLCDILDTDHFGIWQRKFTTRLLP